MSVFCNVLKNLENRRDQESKGWTRFELVSFKKLKKYTFKNSKEYTFTYVELAKPGTSHVFIKNRPI